jgi:hypothetical protein
MSGIAVVRSSRQKGEYMKHTTMIKEKLVDPALERGELETLQQASNIWKVVAEAEKLELDTAQLRSKSRSESMRFWVPIIAPLVGAAALIGTLLLQIEQFNKNIELTRQAAEDAAWREVVKGVSMAVENPLQGVFSMTQMKTFLDSPRYSQAAREISVEFLSRTFDPYTFRGIFPDIGEKTNWKNFRDLIRLASKLNSSFQMVSQSREKPNTKFPKDEVGRPRDPSALMEALSEEINIVNICIAKFLKNPMASRPGGSQLSFNGVQFSGVDLSKIDFSGCELSDTMFFDCTVAESDFSNISVYDESYWEKTAWWYAGKMDKGLLDYLEKKFPYKKDTPYWEDSNEVEYLNNVERLQKH